VALLRSARRTCLAVALATVLVLPSAAFAGVGAGDGFPAFTLVDWNGTPTSLNDIGARIVIIEFCASWCLPCRQGLPRLAALVEELGRDDVKLVGISIDQSRAAADQFADTVLAGKELTLLRDPGGSFMARLGAPGMPALYVVVDGTVRLVESGYSPEQLEAVKQVLSKDDARTMNAE
jgi:thiol-disulfide isomerase/thioredoxin